jgi:hypothetical protein
MSTDTFYQTVMRTSHEPDKREFHARAEREAGVTTTPQAHWTTPAVFAALV